MGLPYSVELQERYQNGEAARVVLMRAADHLYHTFHAVDTIASRRGDLAAIDLLDGIRADMLEEAEKGGKA